MDYESLGADQVRFLPKKSSFPGPFQTWEKLLNCGRHLVVFTVVLRILDRLLFIGHAPHKPVRPWGFVAFAELTRQAT